MWSALEASAPRESSAAPRRSPYWLHRHAFGVLASAVIVMTVGGVQVAAEMALPGEALYPVKVTLNDGAIELVAVTSEAKARAKVTLVERRTEEVEALAEQDELTPELAEAISDNIEGHVAEAVSLAAESGASSTAADIVSTELAVAVGESSDAFADARDDAEESGSAVAPEPEEAESLEALAEAEEALDDLTTSLDALDGVIEVPAEETPAPEDSAPDPGTDPAATTTPATSSPAA